MSLPLFTLTGNIGSVIGGSQVPSAGMTLVLKSNVRPGDLLAIDGVADFVGTVAVMLDNSGKINGDNGIKLLANDAVLGLSTPVQWTISSSGLFGSPEINPWIFDAPNTGETLDLLDTVPVAGSTAIGITRGPQGPQGPQGPPGTTTWAGITDKFTINGQTPIGGANLTVTDATAEKSANKNQPSGYAGLDSGGKVAAAQLPSYVDDVLEYANLAAFPSTGQQTGIIYVADDTGKTYRWSGSTYIEISPSPGSTDSVSEGSANLYYTNARADARVAAAITNNADGTLSVTGVNSLEPLSTVTILTASTAPAIGQTTYYKATSGNLTPPLPALSGLRVGARLAVRRDPADVSTNTVTLTCAGSDTFYSSGSTSATLPLSGEQREYQVISVSGTKYWAPAGSLNPVSALDSRYLHAWPFPMARNTIAAIGDSNTANGEVVGYQPALGHSYLQQLQILTHQRIRFGAGNFAISGTTIDNALTVQLPNVLAMNPLPGACVIASATNDLWVVAAPNPNFSTMKTKLKSIVAALISAGIVPILWTVPPNTNTTSGITPANYQANIHQWNTWVRRYASLWGFPLIDAHAALAATDGTFLSGLGATDLIHANGAGERAIAQQALADGLANWFPPNSLIRTARQTNDLSNLFNDGTTNLGLFTTDTNADGVADGLTASGTATYSLVAPVPSDNLKGMWQQMTVTAGNTAVLQATLTGWATGDVLAVAIRVQTEGVEAAGANLFVAVVSNTPGGYTPPGGSSTTVLYNGMENYQAEIEDGEAYVEFPVLTEMTVQRLYFWVSSVPSGTVKLRVGEATIRNLTAIGGLTT